MGYVYFLKLHHLVDDKIHARATGPFVGKIELLADQRLGPTHRPGQASQLEAVLNVGLGEAGIVVDVKVFTREGGDELGPGVNQVVRVYIAQKRKISVGDKMAGRHGRWPGRGSCRPPGGGA